MNKQLNYIANRIF